MARVPLSLAALAAATALGVGCGGGDSDDESDRELRVPSNSMAPTYRAGDTVQVQDDPESVGVGDAVIYHPPRGADTNTCGVRYSATSACPRPTRGRSSANFMARIVAKPGDRVKILGGRTYVDGQAQDEGFARLNQACDICNLPDEITVPDGHVFLMGDNRGASADSRVWGPVPSDSITGKVVASDAGDGPKIE